MFGFIVVLLLLVSSSQALPQHEIGMNLVDETHEASVALNRTFQSAITGTKYNKDYIFILTYPQVWAPYPVLHHSQTPSVQ